jgi:hypothetical protein
MCLFSQVSNETVHVTVIEPSKSTIALKARISLSAQGPTNKIKSLIDWSVFHSFARHAQWLLQFSSPKPSKHFRPAHWSIYWGRNDMPMKFLHSNQHKSLWVNEERRAWNHWKMFIWTVNRDVSEQINVHQHTWAIWTKVCSISLGLLWWWFEAG